MVGNNILDSDLMNGMDENMFMNAET